MFLLLLLLLLLLVVCGRSGVGIAYNRPYMNTTLNITGGLGEGETQISYATNQK